MVDTPARQGLINIIAGITGVLGLCLSFIPFIGFFFFPLGVIAIVFGILGRKQEEFRKFDVSGMVLGFITSLLQAGFVLFMIWGTIAISNRFLGIF